MKGVLSNIILSSDPNQVKSKLYGYLGAWHSKQREQLVQ